MLNFRIAQCKVLEVLNDDHGARTRPIPELGIWVDRNDISDMEMAEAIAASATELTGRTHLAIDAGEWTSPRYDVIEAPVVGAEVSYGFNGDYYPDGKIERISKSYRVIRTTTGGTYYRRKQSAAWVREGGTWVMVPGVRNERNPSF